MKKEVLLSVLVVLLVLSVGVFAQELANENSNQETIEKFITEFIEGTDLVDGGNVQSVSTVNQSELPDDLEIKEIAENNVGIFEVNFTTNLGESKKVFVVTYATNDFKRKEIINVKNIQNLFFGLAEERISSDYLETASGVKTGEQIGYVMLREGSITGISSSLEISGNGKLFISVYKNGIETGFHNLISTEDSTKIDFDLQSENIVNYKPGDIISVYVNQIGNVNWKNVVTSVETTS